MWVKHCGGGGICQEGALDSFGLCCEDAAAVSAGRSVS